MDLVDFVLVEALTDVDLALVEALTETESDVDFVPVTAEVDLMGLVYTSLFFPSSLRLFLFFFFLLLFLIVFVLSNKVIFCNANCYVRVSFSLRHKLSIALDNELVGDFDETA